MAYRTLSNISIMSTGSELSAEADPFDPVSPMRWAHQEYVRSEKRKWMLEMYPEYYPTARSETSREAGGGGGAVSEKFYVYLAFADPTVYRETQELPPTQEELTKAERDFKIWMMVRAQKLACERV